jgi:hypothetical protein
MHKTICAPLVVLVMTGCGGSGGGGGGSGGGSSEPPPPQEPPVVTTPTAVRVTGPTPFSSACLAVPAEATAYTDAEVEPHLAVNPTNPNHLVAALHRIECPTAVRAAGNCSPVDGGVTRSRPQPAPFTQCGGGSLARASDPGLPSAIP